MAALEAAFPRRPRLRPRSMRWFGNLGVVALSALLARLLLPIAPLGAALWSAQHGLGLFRALALPDGFSGIVCLFLLDLAVYWQHRIFHTLRPLWRIHRMHHADVDLDASTGVRFHPVEILLSLLLKIGLVVLLGAPAWAVLTFEVVLNGSAMFNHANLALPAWFDRLLRTILVTPDMHRVHHSTDMREANRNFGFCLSCWDRLFLSYKDQPDHGHENMEIGLKIFRDRDFSRLDKLLAIPFL